MTIEELSKEFKEKGRSLGSVESFTGGLFASLVTKIPGASKFFKGALVTYATEEKNRFLGISYQDIEKYGVVSKEVAAAMSGNGRSLLNVDYCVSFTGNAGPDAMEGKPVGEVYIGVSAYELTRVYSFNFQGSREEIQNQAIIIACELLHRLLLEKN